MTGSGRGTQVAVLGAVAALVLALCAIVLLGLRQNQDRVLEAFGVATVPPPDVSRANSKLRGNVAAFFGSNSYPDEARDAGQEGAVRALLQVAATGRVTDCRVVQSSGSQALDRRTCEIAVEKVRFDPARDSRGMAIGSTYRLAVRWQLPSP